RKPPPATAESDHGRADRRATLSAADARGAPLPAVAAGASPRARLEPPCRRSPDRRGSGARARIRGAADRRAARLGGRHAARLAPWLRGEGARVGSALPEDAMWVARRSPYPVGCRALARRVSHDSPDVESGARLGAMDARARRRSAR